MRGFLPTCISLLLFLFLVPDHILAKEDAPPVVRGQVKHKETQEEIPYLTVLVKGTSIGTSTDMNGTFVLKNLSSGHHVIRVQGIGYKPVEKEVSLSRGEEKKLHFEIQEDVFNLESAVVSANRNKQDRSETPVIISALTPKLFEQTESLDLTESLKFTPGLRTETSCQNCGVKQLRMNGLEGQYTQILINSKPLFSSLASVYGLEQIPSAMIERIEVVRGGGSALFGGNAIAGTVNLITREPLDDTYSAKLHGLNVNGQSNDYSLQFNTSIVNDQHTSGIFLFGMDRNRSSFDANDDGFTEIPLMENTSFGFNTYFRPTKLGKIVLDFHRIHEYRRGGDKLSALPHESDIAEEVTHDITGVSVSYDRYSKDEKRKVSVYSCGQFLNRDSYYGANHDPAGYGETEDLKSSMGFQFNQQLDRFLMGKGDIFAGFDWTYNDLNDQKLGNDTILDRTIVDQEMNTLGGYLQAEWEWNKLKFLLGARLDHYQIENKLENTDLQNYALCPRINALYDVQEDLQLRVSLAKGYRAPRIFSEDLHIESSHARKVIHRNSPDLQEETSLSLSTSLDYTGKLFDRPVYFLLEGFYTTLKDPFANEIRQEDRIMTYYRVNSSSDAIVKGLNIEGKLMVHSSLEMKLGITFEDKYYEEAQEWGEDPASTSTQMLKAPDQYGYLIASWTPHKNWNVTLTGNYTGNMLVPHLGVNPSQAENPAQREDIEQAISQGFIIGDERLETTTPFYNLAFSLSYDWNIARDMNLKVKAGVKNFLNSYQESFDKGVFRDAGYIYGPMLPRSFMISAEISHL